MTASPAPLSRAIGALAVPMALEMMMESIFAVADMFWVSHLGSDAVAAIGITESIMGLGYSVAMGLSAAAVAVVSRRVGEQDGDGAAVAAVQVIALGAVVSLALGLIGGLLAPRLLDAMGASSEAVARGGRFARILLGGVATTFLIFIINAVFRGAGDAAVAMRTLGLANLLNVVLGPCLIFGWGPFPELGVAGAAVATTVGRGGGVLYQLRALARGTGQLRVRRHHVRIDRAALTGVLRIAGHGIGQRLVNTTSWLGLTCLLAPFGSAALAGYAVAMRLVTFAVLPALGLANAAATLVGQSLGAGWPEHAEQAVWTTARYTLWLLTAIGAILAALGGPIIRAFPGDPAMHAFGATALRIIASGFPFYAYALVLSSAFNGAGDTRTPVVLSLICFGLCQLPLAWALSGPIGLGGYGVAIAAAVAFSMLALASVLVFRRGGWKRSRV